MIKQIVPECAKKLYLQLNYEDRRLRFFASVTDEYIEEYFKNFSGTIYGYFIEDDLVGVLETVEYENFVEIATVVDKKHRGKGISTQLIKQFLTTTKPKEVRSFCLASNLYMKKLCKSLGMTLKTIEDECMAVLI